jgi:hypothetical protein
MDVLVDSETLLRILNSRHWRPVQELVVGKVETVEVSVLWRHRHEPLTACCIDKSGRVGDVPVVPVSGHKLEMVLVSAGLRVEDDDGAREQIVSLADAVVEVWRGIANRHIQEPRGAVQGRGSPGSTATDRSAQDILPGRRVERRGALRPANRVAFDLRHEIEFPNDFAGLGVERVHAPLAALEVAACVADED